MSNLNQHDNIDKPLNRILRMYQVNYATFLPSDKQACIVDLGCRNRESVLWLTRLGYQNIHGVDRDTNKLEQIRQQFADRIDTNNISEGDILTFVRSWDYNFVDLFLMNNVIEHLKKEYLLELIPKIERALKSGGIFIAKTGNMENPFNLGLFARDFTHEVFFAGHSLRKLMMMCGFESNGVSVYPVKSGLTLFNWPIILTSHVLGWLLKIVARLMLVQIRETAALIYCVAQKSA
ncbi:MAG: class I SAM-dependent methyltransferase [Chloroflexi bacterium]|nr:class I SAM-dependent methyltransferase [Chloroflexota bacterium]